MKSRALIFAVAVTLTGAAALAKEVIVTDRFEKSLPMDVAGAVVIENPIGNVEVVGSDESSVSWVAEKVVRGADRQAVDQGRLQVQLRYDLRLARDERAWVLRTLLPPFRTGRWVSSVNYTLRVPRTADVRVTSHSSDRIRISDVRGNVTVTNLNGAVVLDGARVGARSLVAAGAVVPAGMVVPPGVLVAGVPAEVKGPLGGTAAERWVRVNSEAYQALARRHLAGVRPVE